MEELTHLMLPSILADKCYSLKSPQEIEFKSPAKTTNDNNKENESMRCQLSSNSNEDKRITSLVYNRLVELTASVTAKSGTAELPSLVMGNSCNAYHLYASIRNMGKLDSARFITQNEVLNVLKKLEMEGLVYSCEDEFHYLPIIN